MADRFTFTMYFYLFFVLLCVTKSFQFHVDGKEDKSCSCYEKCQKNFTTNSINDDQTKEACHRGCRLYSLVLHTSNDLNPTVDHTHAKEGCMISCSESYFNPAEVSACNFGCSSLKKTESCDYMEHHLPQITYSLIIEESDVLIHPGDPDPDDVLIDPGLRKQIEKTLETILDPKPKIPEIHFRNLPISNKETALQEHPRTTFKCPKFYGFDPKLEFRNGKITTSDLFFLFSVLVFAMVCFAVSRNLEKQMKLWKQLLMNIIQTRPSLMKLKEDLEKNERLLKGGYEEKLESNKLAKQPMELIDSGAENIDSQLEGITLVLYDDEENYGQHGNAKLNGSDNNNTLKL